MSDHIINCTT